MAFGTGHRSASLSQNVSQVTAIFLNGPIPASFSIIFCLFKQILQFLQQLYVKKCPYCIRCRDSNPQPSERESLPITTRPGLTAII